MAETPRGFSWERRRAERVRRLSRLSLYLMAATVLGSLMAPRGPNLVPPLLAHKSYWNESGGRRWTKPLLAAPGTIAATPESASRTAPASLAGSPSTTSSTGLTAPLTASAGRGEPLTATPWGPALGDYVRALRDSKTATATVERARSRVESALPARPATPSGR